MKFYLSVLDALQMYFNRYDWQKLFLEGGCYWLANVLKSGIPGSYFMINRVEEHCALYFNRGLYDVRGKISTRNFYQAKEKDINFMKKNYVPRFDTKKVEEYLRNKEILYHPI